MSVSALSFSGTVYMGLLDTNKALVGGYRQVGNVYPLSLNVTTEQKTQPSAMRATFGQTLHTKTKITAVSGSAVFKEWFAKNFAWALAGEDVPLTGTGGSVSAESVTLIDGEWVRLANKGVSNVVITGSVLGTDFNVNGALGLIQMITGGNLSAGANNVDYDYAAESGYKVKIGTQAQIRVAMMIDGENLESGEEVHCEFDSVVLSSSSEINLISDPDSDFDEMPFNLVFETLTGKDSPGFINGIPM